MTLDDHIFKDVFFGPNSSFHSPLTPLTSKMVSHAHTHATNSDFNCTHLHALSQNVSWILIFRFQLHLGRVWAQSAKRECYRRKHNREPCRRIAFHLHYIKNFVIDCGRRLALNVNALDIDRTCTMCGESCGAKCWWFRQMSMGLPDSERTHRESLTAVKRFLPRSKHTYTDQSAALHKQIVCVSCLHDGCGLLRLMFARQSRVSLKVQIETNDIRITVAFALNFENECISIGMMSSHGEIWVFFVFIATAKQRQ